MNINFVKKMIKAEMLRYEAIKEILPEGLKRKVNSLEKNSFDFIKGIAVEIVQEKYSESKEQAVKETKKINVDFS